MAKQNCWEVKKCGKQKDCPAFLEDRTDGMNGGKNGGRVCYAITGTLCSGKVQGGFAAKLAGCSGCEFYKSIMREEGSNLVSTRIVLTTVKGKAA